MTKTNNQKLITKNQYLEYVMSLTPEGMKEGRDNVVKLMNILGNPQDTLRVFHVAGSNGKGSVCQMISQVLWKSFGKKIGLFTSPHFISINERFQINGSMIGDRELDKYYEKVVTLSKKHTIPLSFFEIQVVAMVLYFTDEKVDYAVVEVGLGGTYDGTNIFAHPLACFLTSITLEHTHVLGKTRESIYKNKLGIVKKSTQLYTPLKHKIIRETCNTIGVKLHTTGTYSGKLSLPGTHQARNAQMVFEALKHVGFEEEGIKKGLQNIYNPGRFEWLTPTVLVDTANNTENIKILAKMVEKIINNKLRITNFGSKNQELITIFGTTQTDPKLAAKLASMIPAGRRILVDGFCDRALPCSAYAHLVAGAEIMNTREVFQFIKKTQLGTIPTTNNQQPTTCIMYGSFYLIGEIMKLSIYKPFAKD